MLAVKARRICSKPPMRATSTSTRCGRRVKLPAGKILMPGVVTHSTDVVEHPELVAQRIQRFADVVGQENVIAGTDCGFGGRSHPQIAWAKLGALVEGAAIASRVLGF